MESNSSTQSCEESGMRILRSRNQKMKENNRDMSMIAVHCPGKIADSTLCNISSKEESPRILAVCIAKRIQKRGRNRQHISCKQNPTETNCIKVLRSSTIIYTCSDLCLRSTVVKSLSTSCVALRLPCLPSGPLQLCL